MKPRVLVVSSANVDLIQRLARVPAPGETVLEPDNAPQFSPGGKGANSAVAFARMGVDTVFCARVGKDQNGARLRAVYERERIDTRFLFTDPERATGMASIFVEQSGANRIIVYPGANLSLSADDVEEAMTCLPDAVYLQFEVPDEPVLAAAKFAARKHIPVFIDAGPARADFPLEALGEVEIFSPNETETFIYTGIHPNTQDNCLRAAIRLASRVKAKYIVLKLGERGSFLYDGKFFHIIPAVDIKVTDTTAAGDVFTAALVSQYIAGEGIADAVRFATYAAAISVSRAGAYPSIPTFAETAALIREREA